MAPARKRGRAPNADPAVPAPRRRTAPAAAQGAPQQAATPAAPARPRARRTARPRANPATAVQPMPAPVPPEDLSTPLEAQPVHTPVISAPDRALQGQISSLTEQVMELRALLQTQPAPSQGTPSDSNVLSTPAAGIPATSTASQPEDAAPFVNALRMLSDPGTLTPNISNEFMPLGFAKLDSSVSIEMRNAIHSRKFISLEMLLPGRVGALDLVFNQSHPHKVSVHSSKLKKFNCFDDWFDAYMIFAAVYVQQFPTEAHGILKHLSTVMRLHRLNSNWYVYDFEFRHFVSANSSSFDVYLPELIERAKEKVAYSNTPTPQNRFRPNSKFFPSRNHFPVPTGFCFNFARFGNCRTHNCQFKHECHFCSRQHGGYYCPDHKGPQPRQRHGQRHSQSSKGNIPPQNRGA